MLGLLDELDAPEAKSRPIIVNCDLANAIELRLTQLLPAIVPIEIARIFLRRTFWVTQTTIWRHQQLSPRASSTGDGVRLAESQRTRRTRVPSCLQCDETSRTSRSPRISFSNVSGALRTRISLWSLRFSLPKVVGIVLWILQGVNDHVAVSLRYSGHITVQGRSIHLELRRNVLHRHFIRAQQLANRFQLLRA